MRVCRLLPGRENRIRAHVSAASGLGPLASEFYLDRSTFADATAHLVVRPAGRVSAALGGPTAESRSAPDDLDRKSTRLNSSHSQISYAVFCLKTKNTAACHHTP